MLPMIRGGSYEVGAGARHVDDAAPADRDRVEAGRRRTAEHLEHVVRAGEQTATVRVEQNRSVHDTVRDAILYCRSTQPCIPPGSLNRVPASAGVRAGMSHLSDGR